MKKILSLVLTFLMILSVVLVTFAEAPTLRATTFMNEAEDTLVVTISISENSYVCGSNMNLIYDPAVLRYESYAQGDILGDAIAAVNANYGENAIRIVWGKAEELVDDGDLITLTFSVLDPKTTEIKFEKLNTFNKDGMKVSGKIEDVVVFMKDDKEEGKPSGSRPGGSVTPVQPDTQEEVKVHGLGFSDVKDGDWFYPGVSFVKEEKLMGGISDTEFAPNGKLTRAMLVTILYRLEGSPESAAPGFSDVPAGEWYSAGVAWAADQGVVNGVGDNLFAPNQNITREQIAVILYNYSVLKGKDVSAASELAGFSDSSTVSSWAEKPLKWAVGSQLIGGKGNNDLDPKGSATRAELATILMRYLAK